LLAQFLLNGEIIACGINRKRTDPKLLQHTIDGVLHQIQPAIENLPILTKGLTFLKYCRLPPVEFVSRGLKTVGYIWCLPKHANVRTGDFNLPKLSDARRDHLEIYPWRSRELEVLAGCFANKPFYKRLYVCLRLGKQTQTVYSSNKLKLRGWFVCVCLDGSIGRFLVLQVYVNGSNDHPNPPDPKVPEAAVSQSARDFAVCT
jgi:hypothetical protein